MGTNYYARINTCNNCGRYTEIHIGKSSCGWRFAVEIQEGYYDGEKTFMKFINQKEVEIWNEYGEKIAKTKLRELIKLKKDDKSHFDSYPNDGKKGGDIDLHKGGFS